MTCHRWIESLAEKANALQMKAMLRRAGVTIPAPPAGRQQYIEAYINEKVLLDEIEDDD